MKDRRSFVKGISAGALSWMMPDWALPAAVKRTSFADHWKFIGVALQEPGYVIPGYEK